MTKRLSVIRMDIMALARPGGAAFVAILTLDTISDTNRAIYSTLDLIDRIKKLPYSYDEDSKTYVWEGRGGKQDNYVRLEVRTRALETRPCQRCSLSTSPARRRRTR